MNTFLKPSWLPQVFRDAEGEGAGGTAEGGTAPASGGTDQMSALEQRLGRITQAVEGMTDQQKRDKTLNVIAARDRELVDLKDKASDAVAASEKSLADAYDNGEGIEIAKAQRVLTEAVAKRERADVDVETFRNQVKAAEKRDADDGGKKLDDTNLNSWKSKHGTWYGVDAEMTKEAHAVSRQVGEAGVHPVGSTQYFEAIDREMGRKYPDKLGGTPSTGGSGGGMQPVNTATSGRIQKSIADGWRRMGIDMSDPKVVERMVKNREAAVAKGILNEQPVSGPVVTR